MKTHTTPTTVKELRAQIDAAKAVAMKRFEDDYGPGAIDGLNRIRKNNAKALDDICKYLDR